MTTEKVSNTNLYTRWEAMKTRCYYKKHNRYPHYGGRGIAVCDEWRESFEKFASWAVANGFRKDLTLERIDNDGNYEPNNCKWIPRHEQVWNTGVSSYYLINGKTMALPVIARMACIRVDALRKRLKTYGIALRAEVPQFLLQQRLPNAKRAAIKAAGREI